MQRQNFGNTMNSSQSKILYQNNRSNNDYRLSYNWQFRANETNPSCGYQVNNNNKLFQNLRPKSISREIIRYSKPIRKSVNYQLHSEYYNCDSYSQFQSQREIQSQQKHSRNYNDKFKPFQVRKDSNGNCFQNEQFKIQRSKILDSQKNNFSIQKKIDSQKESLLSKKSTVDSEQTSQSNRQRILEDIKIKFKTPKKIHDLLRYMSQDFNQSNCESLDEEILFSSFKSEEEKWQNKTDDGFYNFDKQKKFSLVNKTYSTPWKSSQTDQKFNLQYYCVFDKLNQRKFSDQSHNLLNDKKQHFNEYKTSIDKIDTQKFLQEVKMALYEKDIKYYRQLLRKQQKLSNQFNK